MMLSGREISSLCAFWLMAAVVVAVPTKYIYQDQVTITNNDLQHLVK